MARAKKLRLKKNTENNTWTRGDIELLDISRVSAANE